MTPSGTILDLEALRPVLQTALDAVIVMDGRGTVIDWSPHAEAIFGWSRKEAVGRSMADMIVPEALRSAHRDGLKRYLDTGEARIMGQRLTLSALTRDRGEIPVELSITRWSDADQPVFLGFIRDISEQRRADSRQRLLMDEVNHRVKNTLAIVLAMAMQTGKGALTVEAFNIAFRDRLQALARSHELITRGHWEGADLDEVIAAALRPYADPALPGISTVRLNGPPMRLSARATVNLSLILHELATNSAKYGAWSDPAGHVELTWRADDARPAVLVLDWVERGGPSVAVPSRRGFGSELIERVAKAEPGGASEFRFLPEGLEASLKIIAQDSAAQSSKP